MENTSSARVDAAWSKIEGLVRAKAVVVALIVLLVGVVLVLIAVLLKQSVTTSTILLALGCTLVTSSVLSAVTEALLRLDTLEPVVARFDVLEERLAFLAGSPALGGVGVHLSRREVDFRVVVSRAVGRLRVVGISANDILAPANCDLLFERIRDGHVDRLQLLLLDWRASGAQGRAAEPAYRLAASLEQKCLAVDSELADLRERLTEAGRSSAIDVRYLAEPPRLSMVIDSDVAIVTPIISTKTGGSSPTFVLTRDGDSSASLYQAYLAEFESIFSRTSVDDSS